MDFQKYIPKKRKFIKTMDYAHMAIKVHFCKRVFFGEYEGEKNLSFLF